MNEEANPYDDDLRAHLWQLKSAGNVITAIKVLREASGLGLKEAKDFIDSMTGPSGALAFDAEPSVQQPTRASVEGVGVDVLREVWAFKSAGKAIFAIKVLREASGLGLKEAKEFVDAMTSPPDEEPDESWLAHGSGTPPFNPMR